MNAADRSRGRCDDDLHELATAINYDSGWVNNPVAAQRPNSSGARLRLKRRRRQSGTKPLTPRHANFTSCSPHSPVSSLLTLAKPAAVASLEAIVRSLSSSSSSGRSDRAPRLDSPELFPTLVGALPVEAAGAAPGAVGACALPNGAVRRDAERFLCAHWHSSEERVRLQRSST